MVPRKNGKKAVGMMVISFILLFLLYSKTVYAAEEEVVYSYAYYEPVYQYEYYMEKNPDVKAYYGSGSVEDRNRAFQHFKNYGMKERRIASPTFDINSYMRAYPDLRSAFGDDYEKYYLHYLKYGMREGRRAVGCEKRIGSVTVYQGIDYSPVFDADYYLAKYPDLRAAFGDDDVLALRHFVRYGMREGRQAKVSFDVKSYRRAHQDLRLAFGNDISKYYLHYMKYGNREGRVTTGVTEIVNPVTKLNGTDYSAVYDYTEYQQRYGDIKAAFGEDDIATLGHFLKYGMKERRVAKQSFDVKAYSNYYEDLQNAYNDDFSNYYLHYLHYGIKEGRKTNYEYTGAEESTGVVYRLYNKTTGEHLFSTDPKEKDKLLSSGAWTYEGKVWSYVSGKGIPVYRIYKMGQGHRYTQHLAEYKKCIQNGWVFEGICWYIDTTDTRDYYTMVNPKATSEVKKYVYTTDWNEVKLLQNLGWVRLYGIHADVANSVLYAKSNLRSVDHYLGGKADVTDYLTKNQNFYLGKPYVDIYDPSYYEPYIPSRGLQCASFVTLVMQSIGCNTDIVIRDTGLNPYQASTWIAFADKHRSIGDIDVYVYDSIDALLKDGKAKKGDIIIFDSTGPMGYYDQFGNVYDNHMGFFWGDEVIYDKMWHTACATTGLGRLGYTVLYDGRNPGNQITNVTPVSAGNRIYLLPVSHH